MDRSFQERLNGECLEIPSGWWTHNVFGLLQPVLFCYGSDADPWFLLHKESYMTVSQHSYAYHMINWNCREPGWTLLTRTTSCIGDNHPMSSVVLQSWNAKADFRIEFLRRKRAGRELPACFLIISTTTQSREKKTSNVNLTVHVVFILVTSTHSRSAAKESSCSLKTTNVTTEIFIACVVWIQADVGLMLRGNVTDRTSRMESFNRLLQLMLIIRDCDVYDV